MDQFFEKFWDTVVNFDHIHFVIAILILCAVCIILRIYLLSTTSKYSKRAFSSKATGEEVAVKILEVYELDDVEVVCSEGRNSDCYVANRKTICLSSNIFRGYSISAISVAAHEAGHAILHSRSKLISGISRVLDPVFGFCSNFSFVIILVGLAISSLAETPIGYYAAVAGLFMFLFAVVYSIVWFPIERRASKLGLKALCDSGLASSMDLVDVKKVLRAGCFESIAALASAILSLLRVLSIVAKAKRK